MIGKRAVQQERHAQNLLCSTWFHFLKGPGATVGFLVHQGSLPGVGVGFEGIVFTWVERKATSLDIGC